MVTGIGIIAAAAITMAGIADATAAGTTIVTTKRSAFPIHCPG